MVDVFEGLDKLNPDIATLSENNLSTVNDWIDTGCYALNAICSGSVYKGIPKGRITGFAGPSGCGKTLIINKIIGNFQAMSPDHWAVVWDTEAGYEPGALLNVGGSPERTKVLPVDTVESCRNQIVKFLDNVIAGGKKTYGKYVIAIDSLGNLASQKEIDDSQKDKSAQDMGSRAKTLKSMMRTITYKAAKAGVTVLFSNHTYDDPAAMFPTLVKNQAGGKGPVYLASLLVQLALRTEKQNDGDEDDVKIPMANKVSGITMRALTVKNRFIPPFLETEIYLNFKTGLYKYAGLLEMALGYNVITQTGSTYTLDNNKVGYFKNWKNDEKIWDSIILKLEPILQQELRFNRIVLDSLQEQITQE
jgi:RecA/RadA recombinase